MKIESLSNPHVKEVVKLRTRRTRKETGLTIVEGVREVQRAEEAGIRFQELFICPEIAHPYAANEQIDAMKKNAAHIFETTKEVFRKIGFGDRQEGVLAVCAPSLIGLQDVRSGAAGLFVVVDHVQKPGNLGAILRTCDGAGVDALLLVDADTDIYNPNCIRASLGTVFSVPVVSCSGKEAGEFLKARNVAIFATSPQASQSYTDVDLTKALAIVVGSEESGISAFWKEQADRQIKVPLRGRVDSLNVSTTTAIVLYEALRQRAG